MPNLYRRPTKTLWFAPYVILLIVATGCAAQAEVSAEADPSDAAQPGIVGDQAPPQTAGENLALDVLSEGDVVSGDDGRAVGEIDKPGEVDTYSFEVNDDHAVLIVEAGDCQVTGGDSLAYELVGPIEEDDDFASMDSGSGCDTVHRHETTKSGVVTLDITSSTTFKGDEDAVGAYSFRVFQLPAPTPVAIEFDQVIRADDPIPGVGTIEDTAQTDLYTFTVKGEQVYEIRGQGKCVIENGDHFDFEINGVPVTRVDGRAEFVEESANGDCDQPYQFTANEDGTARLAVMGETFRTTGTYSFVVRPTEL